MSGASGRFIASGLIFATSGVQSRFSAGLEVHQHSRAVEPKSELFSLRLDGWNRHVNWVLCWVRRSRLMTLATLAIWCR